MLYLGRAQLGGGSYGRPRLPGESHRLTRHPRGGQGGVGEVPAGGSGGNPGGTAGQRERGARYGWHGWQAAAGIHALCMHSFILCLPLQASGYTPEVWMML